MSLQGYLILTVIIITVGMIVVMTIRNRKREYRDFIAGVERGLEDYRQGKMRPWTEVKKELEDRHSNENG